MKFTIIHNYAKYISKLILGRKVHIKYDKSKPNGVKRKVLDVSLAKNYGWESKVNLRDAILNSYSSFINKKK